MTKRPGVPSDIETELFIRSRRRCCICFGLDQSLSVRKGQIAHLDRNPSNNRLDNLAWLCHDHHDEYDSSTRQSKGLTIREVKSYRELLYDTISAQVAPTWRVGATYPMDEVPMLVTARRIDPKPGLTGSGLQLTDTDIDLGAKNHNPWLYLDFFFKRSRLFGSNQPDEGEKWLYVEANMRPALNLRIQVRAWNERDVAEFIRFLRSGGRGYDLHGPRPARNTKHTDHTYAEDLQAGDYLYAWQEEGQYRLLVSTFTATNAGISVHARLTKNVANRLADYLDEVGFSSRNENSG
jgi:hypothetical protein